MGLWGVWGSVFASVSLVSFTACLRFRTYLNPKVCRMLGLWTIFIGFGQFFFLLFFWPRHFFWDYGLGFRGSRCCRIKGEGQALLGSSNVVLGQVSRFGPPDFSAGLRQGPKIVFSFTVEGRPKTVINLKNSTSQNL